MKKKLRAIVEDSHFFELIKWELESFELSWRVLVHCLKQTNLTSFNHSPHQNRL